MMRKTLKRVLDRLRARTNDAFRTRTATRSGLQEPQRMSLLGVRP
ncbi:MAG TPA: hypothetical protein VFA66_15370 [Gaiellaceae bacterium]|nr:hypothetical protein [Gaiellaceae bacterium]